jgi:hypothetical protein
MTLQPELMNAILSMDAYNRGYDAGIDLIGTAVGDAQIIQTTLDGVTVNLDSAIIRDPNTGERRDDDIGFYALAYDYNGETVISYRGTDDFDGITDYPSSLDVPAWLLGGGNYRVEQGIMALAFYNEVAADPVDTRMADISFTGHSLGGGLASYAAALYGKQAEVFDSMGYVAAANNAHFYASTVPQSDPQYNMLAKPIIDYVYKDVVPWVVDTSGVSASHAEGEILHASFTRQAPSISYELYDGGYLSAIEKHDMASLIIRLFAEENEITGSEWQESAPYFWGTLYDGEFAQSIGMDDPAKVGGRLLEEAENNNETGKYADILRQAIAYSAIDEGTTVFGGSVAKLNLN